MDSAGHNSLVQWLMSPAAYPHRPSRVEHIETHISHVFLAGDDAYKLKKPVRFDFLDFSTLAAREQACRDELRLNRRLAPSTYIDVIPVTQSPGGTWQLAGAGEIVDWLVQMRRLPTDQTLDVLFSRHELTPEHIDGLAQILIRFYGSLKPLSLEPEPYVERYRAHIQANCDALRQAEHHLPAAAVDRVHNFQLQLLAIEPELFVERVQQRRIVEGHGDLRPEHICLSDPITIFDCIEFSADFRRLDVLDELAFLAAECDLLGAPWIGPQIRTAYEAATGDQAPEVLWSFYKSYRAAVRAKVAALREDQVQGPAHDAAASDAHRHLALADSYVSSWLKPLVIVVGGLSGTGKTTLATAIADRLGARLLRTDTIRRDLFGRGENSAPPDTGLYTPEARRQVYTNLFGQAADDLSERISIVLDGTFSLQGAIEQAHRLAHEQGARFLAIECTCPPEIAQERIKHRHAIGTDASDARPETHAHQRTHWQPWPAGIPQIRIATHHPLEEQLLALTKALQKG
jgi:uncharacterized protein